MAKERKEKTQKREETDEGLSRGFDCRRYLYLFYNNHDIFRNFN